MNRLILALPLLPALLIAAPAQAQPIDMSGGGPVEVTSRDGFDWRENDQVVIANGDARAVRGDVTVLADQLVAHYRKKADAAAAAPTPAKPGSADPADAENGGNEIYRLEAHGHVRILTETDEAVGDDAIYDIDQAVLVMTGKAMKLTTPQDVMTARDTMEYWSQLHMSVGRGNAVVVTSDGRRLSGDILVAYSQPDDTTAAPDGSKSTAASTAPAKVAAASSTAAKPATGDPMADSSKLKRVDAFGNVEVRTATDTVRGDRGSYLKETDMARVVGHVRITHGNNQVNGPAADIDMATGIARINAAPGTRVQGLIVPNDAKDVAAKPAPTPPAQPASSAKLPPK
jgi:lipopolysaccharide export system protein LptA